TEEEKEIPFTVKEPKITEKPESIEKPQIIAQKPKITPVSVEEIEAESIPSTGTDLFNVFSSVGEKTNEKLPTLNETFSSLPAKEKKKKDDKKKKKEEREEITKTDAVSFVGFGDSKPEVSIHEEYENSTGEELPSDKDSLYQELIALEGKRYSLEKSFKEIEKSYTSGSINDIEYNKQSDELRGKLDNITSRINNIRRVISSL
ncbi:MAG: CdvA-like protein, partial [Candidatus Lokiarchaeota archaeon]|nr:CdvA-like protein [Candidatus Lokiarchaeota archaeon]